MHSQETEHSPIRNKEQSQHVTYTKYLRTLGVAKQILHHTLLFLNLTQSQSASLMSPLPSSRIVLHLMSRWMMFLLWR